MIYRFNKLRVIFLIALFFLNASYGQINVACVGNSITQGKSLTNPGVESYPAQLQQLLGSSYIVHNYGAGGRTLLRGFGMSYNNSDAYNFSRYSPRDIVVILLGTNDTQDTFWSENVHFEYDYATLINEYKNYPGFNDPVFVLGLPPPILNESWGLSHDRMIDQIIPHIQNVANNTGTTIANFYTPLDGHPEYFSDGVHPTAEGAGIIAAIARDAIQQALATQTPDTAPSIPTGFTASTGQNFIKLDWNANPESNVFSYHLFRGTVSGGSQQEIATIITPSTTYIDYDVIPGNIYYYSIAAVNTRNHWSQRSSTITSIIIDVTPPSSPANLAISHVTDAVNLSWTQNTESDLSRYNIYRSTDLNNLDNTSNKIATVWQPNNHYSDQNFAPTTTYFYGVTAVDISNNQSLMSNTAIITTTTPPITADTTIYTREDVPHRFSANDFLFYDVDGHSFDKLIITETNDNSLFTYDGFTINPPITCDDITKLEFVPPQNLYGENFASFGFRVVDSFGNTSIDTNRVIIHVASVNDAPYVDEIDNLMLVEGALPRKINLTGINAGPDNELQTISILTISSNSELAPNPELFYTASEDTGSIIVTPGENAFGNLTISVIVTDDGGAENGGVNMFTRDFSITIIPINDPPQIDAVDTLFILEDAGSTTIKITGITAGQWEDEQELNISTISNNTMIIPHPTIDYHSPDISGELTVTTIADVNGITSIEFSLKDDGGTENYGIDSSKYTIPIKVLSVNDAPQIDVIDTLFISEDAGSKTFQLTGITAGRYEDEQSISFSVKPNDITKLASSTLNYSGTGSETELTLTTIPNAFGLTSIELLIKDDGGVENNGVDSTLYTIPVQIRSINDPPNDFNLFFPDGDTAIVINKINYRNSLKIGWEESVDTDNENIIYNLIFSGKLESLSQYNLTNTNYVFTLLEILAATDSVNIATETFTVFASDNTLETEAINGPISLTVDGHVFAPSELGLDQNYPNPFNGTTIIGFSIPRPSKIYLKIYDVLGNEVRTLVNNKSFSRGYNTIKWDGTDKNGAKCSAGIYFVHIRMGAEIRTNKLLYLK